MKKSYYIKRPPEQDNCLRCGNSLEGRRANCHYCSHICRHSANNERYRQAQLEAQNNKKEAE